MLIPAVEVIQFNEQIDQYVQQSNYTTALTRVGRVLEEAINTEILTNMDARRQVTCLLLRIPAYKIHNASLNDAEYRIVSPTLEPVEEYVPGSRSFADLPQTKEMERVVIDVVNKAFIAHIEPYGYSLCNVDSDIPTYSMGFTVSPRHVTMTVAIDLDRPEQLSFDFTNGVV